MRPTGRIPKLSKMLNRNTVVLSPRGDGTFEVMGVDGIKYDPRIEEQVERASSCVKQQSEESADVLCAEIEARYNVGKLGRKDMGIYTSLLLGYKNANLSYEERKEIRAVERARARIWDRRQMMEVAAILATKQQSFLRSQDDSDIERLTYVEIATHIKNASEPTVRRLIKDIKLKIGEWTVPAKKLVTRKGITELKCRVTALLEKLPRAGAPKLHALLVAEGFKVSQRTVGSIRGELVNSRKNSLEKLLVELDAQPFIYCERT